MRRYEIVAKMKYEMVKFEIISNILFVGDEEYYLKDYEEDLLKKYMNSSGLTFTGWASEDEGVLSVEML